MGSIHSRRRKDGTTGYTAQIRIHCDHKLVHTESQTFDRRTLADQWLRRRESELDTQRARGELLGKRMTLEELVTWYESREREPWGRSKRNDLKRLRTCSLAKKQVDHLSQHDFIAYIEARRDAGAGPATAGSDLIWFRQVFRSARAVLGVSVPLAAVDDAAAYLRDVRTIAKARKRERRRGGGKTA